MMDISIVIKGLILGFSFSAPIGPIGIICIRRTLEYGKISGILSGVGSAFVYIIWSAVAAFGLSSLASFAQIEPWLNFFGGIFLVVLGFLIMRSNPSKTSHNLEKSHWLADISSTFMLTLTNPLSILSFIVFFENFGLAKSVYNFSSGSQLVTSVFLGSAAWWVLLTLSTSLLRDKISEKVLKCVNRCAGLLIMGYGLFSFYQFFYPSYL